MWDFPKHIEKEFKKIEKETEEDRVIFIEEKMKGGIRVWYKSTNIVGARRSGDVKIETILECPRCGKDNYIVHGLCKACHGTGIGKTSCYGSLESCEECGGNAGFAGFVGCTNCGWQRKTSTRISNL